MTDSEDSDESSTCEPDSAEIADAINGAFDDVTDSPEDGAAAPGPTTGMPSVQPLIDGDTGDAASGSGILSALGNTAQQIQGAASLEPRQAQRPAQANQPVATRRPTFAPPEGWLNPKQVTAGLLLGDAGVVNTDTAAWRRIGPFDGNSLSEAFKRQLRRVFDDAVQLRPRNAPATNNYPWQATVDADWFSRLTQTLGVKFQVMNGLGLQWNTKYTLRPLENLAAKNTNYCDENRARDFCSAIQNALAAFDSPSGGRYSGGVVAHLERWWGSSYGWDNPGRHDMLVTGAQYVIVETSGQQIPFCVVTAKKTFIPGTDVNRTQPDETWAVGYNPITRWNIFYVPTALVEGFRLRRLTLRNVEAAIASDYFSSHFGPRYSPYPFADLPRGVTNPSILWGTVKWMSIVPYMVYQNRQDDAPGSVFR